LCWQDHIIAGHLAFERQLLLDPPHRRMKEQNAQDFLDRVCPVIPPP
jgi:hypothetical protein